MVWMGNEISWNLRTERSFFNMGDKRQRARVQGAWATPTKSQSAARPGKNLSGLCMRVHAAALIFPLCAWAFHELPLALLTVFLYMCLPSRLLCGGWAESANSLSPVRVDWGCLLPLPITVWGHTPSSRRSYWLLLRLFSPISATPARSRPSQTPGPSWRSKEQQQCDPRFVFKEPQLVKHCFFFNNNKAVL